MPPARGHASLDSKTFWCEFKIDFVLVEARERGKTERKERKQTKKIEGKKRKEKGKKKKARTTNMKERVNERNGGRKVKRISSGDFFRFSATESPLHLFWSSPWVRSVERKIRK